MHVCSCADPWCMTNGCRLTQPNMGPMWIGPYRPPVPIMPVADPSKQFITKQHIKDIVIEVLEELKKEKS